MNTNLRISAFSLVFLFSWLIILTGCANSPEVNTDSQNEAVISLAHSSGNKVDRSRSDQLPDGRNSVADQEISSAEVVVPSEKILVPEVTSIKDVAPVVSVFVSPSKQKQKQMERAVPLKAEKKHKEPVKSPDIKLSNQKTRELSKSPKTSTVSKTVINDKQTEQINKKATIQKTLLKTASKMSSESGLSTSSEILVNQVYRPEDLQKETGNKNLIKKLESLPKTAAGLNTGKKHLKADDIAVEPVKKTILATAPKNSNANKVKKASTKKPVTQKTYGMWQLAEAWQDESRDNCRLSSYTMQVEDDQYTQQFWLSIQSDKLLLHTSSNLNLKKKGSGIRLDDGKLIPFSNLVYPTQAVLLADLSSRLSKTSKLDIYMAPGYPKARLQHAVVDTSDLEKAIPALISCNR